MNTTLKDLSQHSGIQIEYNSSNRNRNINLIVTDFFEYANLLRKNERPNKTIDDLGEAICSLSAQGNHLYLIKISLIYIPTNLSERQLIECIIEEFTQGLGLFSDSELIPMSIMTNDKIYPIRRLPLNDKILVRTLYDKRIKPGMTKAEAMPLVRIIIPELVAAVKKHGESALHQKSKKFPLGMEDSSIR